VSLLLKSELRLRVGARHCVAEVWRAGVMARCVARAFAQDETLNLVETAMAALEARGIALPTRATLSVEDELLYFASLPATMPARAALVAAREHFSAALGEHELLVGVTLTSSGQRWLASALPAELLEAWRMTLNERDITLQAVQPAVLHDLQGLGTKILPDHGLVVLARNEGLSLVSVDTTGVTELNWERRDLSDLPGLAARVQAQLAQMATLQDALDPSHPGVLLAPLTEAQAISLRPLAEAQGWRMSAPVLVSSE
jgi:hypothetical protein